MLIVKRSPGNPLIIPSRARSFEAVGTCNPSVVRKDGVTHMFYRAFAEPDALLTPERGFSTIGYAKSRNIDSFDEHSQVISPTEEWEKYGCEDPRATYFEGKWYVFYTALAGYPFGPDNIKVAVAIGDRPDALTEKHLITPFNAKAATLFPERVNGEVVLLLTAHTDFTETHPRPTIGIARAKEVAEFFDPAFWDRWHKELEANAIPDVRRADTEHMEVAATPVRIKEGWLLIYSHIQDYYDEPNRIFGVEALVLDANDPRKILMKTAYPFMVPEESYERYGLVTNVVFPTGVCIEGDTLHIYYGAADTSCAMASLSLPHLLSTMSEESRSSFMQRLPENPIMSPIEEHGWESRSVSNAAAIDLDGSVHLVYRAMGADNTSVMGYARLEDGLHIDERLEEPVYAPSHESEQKQGKPDGNSGTEDPRLTLIDGVLTLAYTAYDGVHEPRGAISTIRPEDFVAKNFNWSPPVLVTPGHIGDKDVCIFPERIDGKIVVIHRIDPDICVERFDSLEQMDTIERSVEIMGPRSGMWDDIKVGAAGPPIKVKEGWLFIYHGVGSDKVYRLGAALLSEDAGTVIARTVAPILEPREEWERIGMVNNVVFSCGAVVRGDTLIIYYGGADTRIGIATLSVKELMNRLLPSL